MGQTEARRSGGWAGYRRKGETLFRFAEEGRKIWSKFWKVLSISYHRHPKITETGTGLCNLYQFPLAWGSASHTVYL